MLRAFTHIEENPGSAATRTGVKAVMRIERRVIHTLATCRKSSEIVFPSTGDSPAQWRIWWDAESRRQHTDWISLCDAAETALRRLRIVHAPKTTTISTGGHHVRG
jgi:hypothetical protein